MSNNITITNKIGLLIVFCTVLGMQATYSQEASTDLNTNSTYHNQLFFNRFLINPTFSLVRESKSYLNILHRNQYATFEDNNQNYLLSFSNKLNDHTALGLGVYSQSTGILQEFGFNANYARSVQLGAKSKLSFGANVTYSNKGIDKNRAIAEENDPEILKAKKESKIAIQPGITLSMGRFDVGLYAYDLFKYNQTTNNFSTNFTDKSIKALIQYTHLFTAKRGLFADAKLMPLLQIGKNEDSSLSYAGSILLDLPKYGWLQTKIDDTYGMSMGMGFNLNKKMSIGYLLEKDLINADADLGWNHEVSLAYTFKDSDINVGVYADSSQDEKIDGIIRNYEEQILNLIADKNTIKDKLKEEMSKEEKFKEENSNSGGEDPNTLAYQNRLILDELILRQDSIEVSRTKQFEKRFETIVRLLRNNIKQEIRTTLMTPPTAYQTIQVANTNNKETKATTDLNKKEHKGYQKLPIKVLNQSDVLGVKSGYYVIANVFKNKKYLNAFMNTLKKQGLNAKQFYNRENGLHYVYLADYNYKQDAENAFVSNLNGKYQDEKWIMEVASNNSAMVGNVYEDE